MVEWNKGPLSQDFSIPSHFTLRSSAWGHLIVPRTQTSITQSRSLAIAGPSNLNKLPLFLRDLFPIPSDQFRKHLKIFLFVSEDTDPGRECLWFKWHYINVWLRLLLQRVMQCKSFKTSRPTIAMSWRPTHLPALMHRQDGTYNERTRFKEK